MLLPLCLAALGCAAVPAVLTVLNLWEYQPPPGLPEPAVAPAQEPQVLPSGSHPNDADAGRLAPQRPAPHMAVCIPARNEAVGIAACVGAVLASEGFASEESAPDRSALGESAGSRARLEVLVVDDSSTDDTAEIVSRLAAQDPRLRLLTAPPLPPGWNGKQHACAVAAAATGASILCFLDADVRLKPAALLRMAALLQTGSTANPGNALPGEVAHSAFGVAPAASGSGSLPFPSDTRDAATGIPAGRRKASAPAIGLVSGFPLEETGTTLEWLLLPLIHYILLGFLPLSLLRRTTLPGFAAGCGQFLMVDRAAYLACGGHAAIRHTMHDGVLLPRLLRRHGYATRLADLTGLARCRMYTSAAATWHGLAKNATEGMAAPGAIVPFTVMLGLGQVLAVPLLLAALLYRPAAVPWAWGAVVLSYLPRLLEVQRFRQRPLSAALHPVGVLALLVLQWYALGRKLLRRPAQWKARDYTAN